jgi:hypothetical protein
VIFVRLVKFVFKRKTDMKKIYMSPKMDVVEIKMHQSILTASGGFGDPLPGGSAVAPEFDDELLPFEGSNLIFE